ATVSNAGTVVGTGGVAIAFDADTATDDTLELLPGARLEGVVEGYDGSDTLVLGGDAGSDGFDTATLRDFELIRKSGASTWTLTADPSGFSGVTEVTGGTLVVADGSTLGGSASVTGG